MNAKWLLAVWIAASAVTSYRLLRALPAPVDSPNFDLVSAWHLPGETTHGHGQIELKCQACHDRGGVREQSCNDCHADALKAGRDTHPAKKFDDPSNAHLLTVLDARSCITCHTEHAAEKTAKMGVSVPADYCWQCHQDVADDRPSHASFAFDSCSTVGCHNYHDNTALYENFLAKHDNEPWLLDNPRRRDRQPSQPALQPLTAANHDGLADADPTHVQDWATSAHAAAGVNCSGCHQPSGRHAGSETWTDAVPTSVCAGCHEDNVDGWHDGLHGMRPAAGLSPMQPGWATLPMKASAASRELTCHVCHGPHRTDTVAAAADACLQCHDDEHSRAWESTAHAALWREEAAANDAALIGTGVSCATCHMPVGEDGRVEHNQNATLEPREKMVRAVCMNCHGLEFTFDALHDPLGVSQCYSQRPSHAVDSVDMVTRWLAEKRRQRNRR